MTSRFDDYRSIGSHTPLLFLKKSALSLFLLLVITACASNEIEYRETQAAPITEPKLVLKAGDEIELKFPYWQELNDTQVIRPDGFITLQLIDSVMAEGLTPEALDEKLTGLYESKIKDPVISVVVRSLVDQRIYVGGEVNSPGLLILRGKVDPLQAVINAGGFKETACMEQVVIIRKGDKGNPVPYTQDLSRAIYEAGAGEDFYLQPNDVVYVPKTTIANMDKWVNQYISELFLFRGIGVNFGFSYELRDLGAED